MKPAAYFLWFLLIGLLSGSGQVYAGKPLSYTQLTTPVRSIKRCTTVSAAEFKSDPAEQTLAVFECIVADEDDEDQHLIGKQAPVLKCAEANFALFALPPPAGLPVKNTTSAQHLSFLRSCHYIAQRALLI